MYDEQEAYDAVGMATDGAGEHCKDGDYYRHLLLARKSFLHRCYTKHIPPQGADTRYVFLIHILFLGIRFSNSSILMKG
jgi:hypothetical protein